MKSSHCPWTSMDTINIVHTIFIFIILLGHPHRSTGQSCEPTDCITSQWTEWSECSESCGDSGVRARTRRILAAESCGGGCEGGVFQSEPCNIHCCAENCVYSEWTSWSSCRCDTRHCEEVGSMRVCFRWRDKLKDAVCGGYCDHVTFEPQCGKPCCYKDCIMGAWLDWGPCDARCESEGRKYRERMVIQEPGCGGERCEYETDAKECTGPCCPQDCVLGPWSDWSECAATCGEGIISRTRFIKQPVCDGAPCNETEVTQNKTCEKYVNVDCQMSPWSAWSGCTLDNGYCGEGKKTRQRDIIIEAKCRGEPCANTTETAVCHGECCKIDCQVEEWSEFGHCSTQCGEGLSNRTRKIVTSNECGGAACPDVVEFQPCTVQETTDCMLTEWTQWSACNTDCGNGKSFRTRTLLTPAYCGGKCNDRHVDEERGCESYAARRDCEVGHWSEWEPCIRDCERGVQKSSRVITAKEKCGGDPCIGKYNLTQTRTCHEKCAQLCNQGVCSCNSGYYLDPDGYSCQRKDCGNAPQIASCGPGTKILVSCRGVYFSCQGHLFEDECHGSCSEGWVVKGEPKSIQCQEDGTWTKPHIFCGPQNKAPVDININSTEVSELLKAGQCFARLTTVVDNESWDKHTYSVVTDPSGTLTTQNDLLCASTDLDFETSKYREWSATLRSTDLDGLHVDKAFSFTLLNANDPPRSAELVPNTIAENSPKGTKIGCFDLVDDDPGQILKMFLLTKTDVFELYNDEDKYCLKVGGESEPDCEKLGGKLCLLNFEEDEEIYIAVMVQDDATPPLSEYFDIGIRLTDVPEPITGVTISPKNVRENIEAGKRLLQLIPEDEDEEDVHKFEILDDPSGLFSVVNDYLVASKVLDYEADPDAKFTIKIKATDVGPPTSSVETEITFGIIDVNEPPYDLVLSSDNAMLSYADNEPQARENMPALIVGTVSVYDPDKGDTVQLSVSDASFRIINTRCTRLQNGINNYCQGRLVHFTAFNFEETPVVPLTITTTDSFNHEVQISVNITVIDMEDPPTDILVNGKITDNITIPENSKDFSVADIEALDEDKNDKHNYFLSGPASGSFRMEGSTLMTKSVSNFDYETFQPTQLIITAVDAEQTAITFMKTFNIVLTDVNEAPSTIVFSSITVLENSDEGTLVAELSAVDPDNSGDGPPQSFIYKLVDDAQGRFYLDGNKLFVKKSSQNCGQQTCTLDYEEENELLIQVRVTDDGEPPMSTDVSKSISVLDANDPPYDIQLSSYRMREDKVKGSIIGTLAASDQDVDSILTFTLLNHTQDFDLQDGIHLILSTTLDYETKQYYDVKVQVQDNGTPMMSYVDTIKIEVLNVNEPPTYTGPDVMTVKENTGERTSIGVITVVDPDKDDAVDIVLKEFQDLFLIENKETVKEEGGGILITAYLTVAAVLDYEAKSEYVVSLSLVDKQGLETIQNININVEDVNDPPEDILLDRISTTEVTVQENTVETLAVLSAVDEDRGQIHTFSIIDQSGTSFTLAGDKLLLAEPLDYETNSSTSLTLEVTDNGNPAYRIQKTITVTIQNVNEPPTELALSNNKVAENSIDGKEVGLLIPSDPDNEDGFEFSLLDDAGGKFRIQGDVLVVAASDQCTTDQQASCSLNYEQQQTHVIKVMVTDSGFPKQSSTFDLQVDITDSNDAPHDIILSANEVEELATAGTVIGEFSVSDEDSGQTHIFTLKNENSGQFRLDTGNKLVKATDERLDISKVYSVTVVVTDNGQPAMTAEKTFYISISGVSEAPHDLNILAQGKAFQQDLITVSIPENAAVNDIIAQIAAQDNDIDQTISFSLLADGDGHFKVSDDAQCNQQAGMVTCSASLMLAQPVDFERKDKYTVIFLATDSDSQQASKTVVIQVSDVGEAPTDIFFSKATISIPENSKSIVVGKFSAQDEDSKDSHTFTLTDNADGIFTLSQSGQLAVTPEAVIDYETKSSFEITVMVADASGNSFSKTFKGNVLNVNERPSNVSLDNNKIPEGSPGSTVIGQLLVDDPDNENLDPESSERQTFEFKLLADADGRFVLDQSTVKLSLKGAECSESWCGLDYETQTSHEIQVQVTDSGSPKLTASFVVAIQVTDENDPPSVADIEVKQLREDMRSGDVVTELSALDEDVGQTCTFSIGEEGSEVFQVDGNKLVIASSLDFETSPVTSVEIIVTDDGTPPKSGRASFQFEVVNVDEPPSSLTLESVTGSQSPRFETDKPVIGENTKSGALIGELIIIDPDNDEDITVVVSGKAVRAENPGCLTLTKGTRCVASILLGRQVDYEEKSSFSVDVSAIDKSGLQLDKTFTFQVKDENDPPVSILINSQNVDAIKVKENSRDSTIATLGVVDPDKGQTFTYSVTGSSQFYIVGNKLKVTSAANIDYEEMKEIEIRLKVTDSGKPPLSLEKEVTVEIMDENEAPTAVTLSRNEVSEDAPTGTEIGMFSTTDPDNKEELIQKFTYELTDDSDGIFKVLNDALFVNEAKLDYEQKTTHVVRVKVTDNGSPSMLAQFDLEIEVLNENDAPTDLQLSASSISEGAQINAEVGTLTAQDSDADQSISFTISNSDVFTIKNDKMVVSGALDFETAPRVSVEVTATDDGTPSKSVTKTFTITVTDVNEAPIKMEFTPSQSGKFEIAEKTQLNAVVGVVETIDPDNIDRISMETSSASSKHFKMDSASATCKTKIIAVLGSTFTVCSQNILLAERVKYKADSTPLILEVIAKDKGQLTFTDHWEFTILDSNDAPTDIMIDADALEIPENSPNFKLGTLECEDPDLGQKHGFQIVTFWEIFKVEQGSVLTSTRALDAESKSVYDVTIRCVDNGVPEESFSKTFSIKVKDVNEPPSDISLSNSEVPMTAQDGETVAFIIVTDPDNVESAVAKQSHTCVVTKDSTDSFKVSDEGNALQIKGQVPVDKDSVMITLNCSDDGVPSLHFVKDFTVFISETADVPKAVVLAGNKTVEENTENVEVGTLSIINELTETEIQGSFFYYDISTAEIDSDIFIVDGSVLKITAPVDFETTPTLTVSLSVSGVDLSGNFIELVQTFKIKVLDQNEPPQQINIYGGGIVAEKSSPGTIIGDLNTLDPEPYQTYKYTLISVAVGLDAEQSSPELFNAFVIEGRTLKVGPDNGVLDYETAPTLSLVIQTVDSGSPPLGLNYTVRIILTDANDAPTDISISNNMISEDATIGDTVGMLSVTDQDSEQSHQCTVINVEDVPFTIEDSVYLRVFQLGLDYEKQRTYVVQVICEDEGEDGTHLKVSKSLTVNVTNVNEAPYDITLSNLKVNEGNVIGQLVGEISATDPDSQQVIFSLGDDNSDFEIKGNGSLTATVEFDFEEKSTYYVQVTATDDGGLFSTTTFTVQVQDVNEKPLNITLTNNVVSENAKKGTLIGMLRTQDPDRGQTFKYTLTESSPDNGHFVIIGDRLETGGSKLDFELSNVHRISVTSKDSGTPSASLTVEFAIEVTDSNEPPLKITLQEPLSIVENVNQSVVLSTVTVLDEDLNQIHSCQILDEDAPFAIVTSLNGTIQLVVSGVVDYENNALYNIMLSCSDGEFDIKQEFTVKVENVNEPPTGIRLTGPQALPAVSSGSYEVGILEADDDDKGQVHTFSTLGINSDILKVEDGNRLILIKPLPIDLLDRPNPSVVITIEVADSGQPVLTYQQNLTLPITGVDLEALKLPEITLDNTKISENAVEGDVIGEIYDLKTTVSEYVVFTIAEDASSLFAVKDNRYLVLSRNISTFFGNSAQVTIEATHQQTLETSSRRITIVIIRSDNCYDNGVTCHEEARCTLVNETYQCQCVGDFEGDGYLCEQIDDCVSQGGNEQCVYGRCKDDVNSFKCQCDEGYTGILCEVPPPAQDPCQDNKCQNKAACKPTNDGVDYICVCGPGWTSDKCETSIDDCEAGVCLGGGTCIDGHLSYLCSCTVERSGHRCQFYKESCQIEDICEDIEFICVPKFEENDNICSPKNRTVQLRIDCSSYTDVEYCHAKFLEFVEENGRFPSNAESLTTASTRKKREAYQLFGYASLFGKHVQRRDLSQSFAEVTRTKRQASNATSEVTAYSHEFEISQDGAVMVTFSVMDSDYVPFTKGQILAALAETCNSIVLSDQAETSYCPYIEDTYAKFLESQKTPEDTKTAELPIGAIAGGAGGLVVLIIIIIVVIIVVKKKRKHTQVEDSDATTHAGKGGQVDGEPSENIAELGEAEQAEYDQPTPS